MTLYYKVAHGIQKLDYPPGFPWPYDVQITFDNVPLPVAFGVGIGHESAGCLLSAQDALDPKWREHLEFSGALWLVPYLEQLAQGVSLPKTEILDRYSKEFGKSPETYDYPLA